MLKERWKSISESNYAWEREALEFIQERLPDREPYRAWSNFEFIADDGSINEVDLLVVTPQGFFFVEIKSNPGRLTGDSGTWAWHHEGRVSTVDNPVINANRKAKKLASLLKKQKATKKIHFPYLDTLVFCSAPQLDCQLEGNARYHVCLRDKEGTDTHGHRDGIIAALEKRQCPGLREYPNKRIDRPVAKAITRAMEQAGIRETHHNRRVSDYVLDRIIAEGPGYQDWHGTHASLTDIERRVRIYSVRTAASPEERQTIRRAAAREFQLLESLQHPGILRAHGFTEHELGPAIIFEHYPKAVRLDHYLTIHGQTLGPDLRLHLLRQIAEAIRYAHSKRIVHRSLSPESILILDPEERLPHIKILNWQTGYRAGGTSSLTRQVTATEHVDQLVEDASTAYMAPEALTAPDDEDGEHLDVFSLGAIAYHLFSNKAPAANALELGQKLRAEGGLKISSVLNGAGEALQFLIQYSTHPDVAGRLDTVDDYLQCLEDVENELTTPDDQEEAIEDPTQAQAGDILLGGYRVIKRLGSGASAVGLLAEQNGQEFVLKIALDPDRNDRIQGEAEVLAKLRHAYIVEFIKTEQIGDRVAIRMRALTRQLKDKKVIETLGQWIRKEGRLHIDMLKRFGEDLLDAVNYLEEQGIPHRDIKPDNLAVANIGRGDKLHLVLFDFSLSRAPADSIRVGTRGYLDPFLSMRKHKRWDLNAERWSAAVTLYEMATARLPVWHDGKTDPAHVTCEVTLDEELFDASLRDGLSTFFLQALRRDPGKRFDNADQMLRAWREVFEGVDEPAVTSDHEEEPDFAALIQTAQLNTQVPELGLSTRATNALDRLNVLTVKDLLTFPLLRFYRMRGVGQKTRREITDIVGLLRDHFGDTEQVGTDDDYAETEAGEHSVVSVDLLADQITKIRKTPSNESTQTTLRAILGLDKDFKTLWPTQAEVGRYATISRARVGQVLGKCLDRWRKTAAVTGLREDISLILESNGSIMTLDEMADAILTTRGSGHDEPLRSRLARAVTRAAVEVERVMAEPRFVVRREESHVLIASQSELAGYGIRLGQAADQIAQEDPLMSPARTLDTLRNVSAPDCVNVLPSARLLRLSAAASSNAAVSSRQELYPKGMEAVRALKLSQGALLGAKKLTVDQIRQRVLGRYPEAEPLPGPPRLTTLLKDAGLDLQWKVSAGKGRGAYVAPSFEPFVSQGTVTNRQRYMTMSSDDEGPRAITPEEATARQFEERLQHNLRDGGFIALTVSPSWYQSSIKFLEKKFGVSVFDLELSFLRALQGTAEAKNVDWDKVVQADASSPDSRDWQRLLHLVRLSMATVVESLFAADTHQLIIYPGLLARYDQMTLMETLRDKAGRPKDRGGIPGVWILIPADEQSALPVMEGKAVPVIGSGQHARIPESWLANILKSNGRRSPKKKVTP